MSAPQKKCEYCATPALPLATKCASCGSALPVLMPRPVARIVEIQSHWSFRTTGIVTSVFSITLGFLYSSGWLLKGPIAGVMLLWILALMPGMLLVSAWMNANRKATKFFSNFLMAIGLWWLGILLCFVGSA